MAVTVTATLVDDASGWDNTPPAGHAGWNNTAGDEQWVPNEIYNKQVLLEITGSAGEVTTTCNWEIFDETVYWVATAATIEADTDKALGTIEQNLALASDTMAVYAWNGTDDWTPIGSANGDFGQAVASLRANGVRTVVSLPAYLKWDTAATESVDFFVAAFLPGSFGVPSGTTNITISNPDEALIGGETGAPQPRISIQSFEGEYVDPQYQQEEAPAEEPKGRRKGRRKKKADDSDDE